MRVDREPKQQLFDGNYFCEVNVSNILYLHKYKALKMINVIKDIILHDVIYRAQKSNKRHANLIEIEHAILL